MKNMLYMVIGKKWNDEKENWDFNEPRYTVFKNKEKANNFKEELLDKYMKTKSYSPKYTIDEEFRDEEGPIPILVNSIYDKHDDLVYCVEIYEVDLSKIVM